MRKRCSWPATSATRPIRAILGNGGSSSTWKNSAVTSIGTNGRRITGLPSTGRGPIRPRIPGARSGIASRRRRTFAPESRRPRAVAAELALVDERERPPVLPAGPGRGGLLRGRAHEVRAAHEGAAAGRRDPPDVEVGVWGAMERKVRLATAVSGVSERPELAPSDRFRYGERVASQQVDVLVAER